MIDVPSDAMLVVRDVVSYNYITLQYAVTMIVWFLGFKKKCHVKSIEKLSKFIKLLKFIENL